MWEDCVIEFALSTARATPHNVDIAAVEYAYANNLVWHILVWHIFDLQAQSFAALASFYHQGEGA